MEAVGVRSPSDNREPLSRKSSQEETWGQAALPHLNSQDETIIVGQKEEDQGKATHGFGDCACPQTGMQKLCEEMEDQWASLNLPVLPVARPTAPLSFATVQWDMPEPSVDLPSHMTDNSSTDELDLSGGASLDWTMNPLSYSVCRERDTELPVQEDTEQCAGLEKRPQPLDNDLDHGVDVSQPCDAPGAGIEDQTFQEVEDDPPLGQIEDNDPETEMDPLLPEGTAGAPDTSLSPPERAESVSMYGVDSQSGTSKEEQETTGDLLTRETDSDQESSSASDGSKTEEEGDKEGKRDEEERERILTNDLAPGGKCEEVQSADICGSGEIEPCEEPPQANHVAAFAVNVEQLNFSEQRLKEETPGNQTDAEEPSKPQAAVEEVERVPEQTDTFVHVAASEESNTAQSKHTEEWQSKEPGTRNEEPACGALKQGEQRDQTEGNQQLEPFGDPQVKQQAHSSLGKEARLDESKEPSEESEQTQHSNKMLVLLEKSACTVHPQTSIQSLHTFQLPQVQSEKQPGCTILSEQSKKSELPEEMEQSVQPEQLMHTKQSEQAELREASEQPNQSENTEQSDASKQPNQSENTEQRDASKQPNQSENTEQRDASKQPNQSENTEQRDTSKQPNQSEQMEQLQPHGRNSGQIDILALSQQEEIHTKQVCEQQQQQVAEETENIEQKHPKSKETEVAKEEKRTDNLPNTQHCQLSEGSRQNVGCTGTGDSGVQVMEENGEPIDNHSEPAPEPSAGESEPVQAPEPVATAVPLMNGVGVDGQKACELAERLYRLDGFQCTDVVKHLDKDNDFSRAVGEEYLKFFDFTDQSLDQALRSFLKVVVLIGETQERERVLQHFSCRYQQCNPDSFSTGSVLTLTCAVMLLNSDLHGENVGKAMSSSNFVSNLDGMKEGEDFSKGLLKSLFNAIKNDPLEWAVDEKELKSSMLLEEDAKEDAPARCKSNPFQDVPHDKKAKVFKQGFLQRKAHADIDGKRTPWGKRSWKTFYGVLKGMVLYLQKDEYRKEEYQSTEEVVSVHHALAEQAADYTKRPHVFRLQTADWRVFLFQASSRAEMSSWISRINLVSALHSSPPFPAAVGSQRRFHRPILPASQSAHTLERQLKSHRGMLESFQQDLAYLQQSLPEGRKAKAKELEEYRQREEYLQRETCRYEVYIQMLEAWDGLNTSAVIGAAEFTRFDRMVCKNPVEDLGEDEREGELKKSYSSPSLEVELAPPPLVKVRRNISERRTYRRIVIPRRNKEL